jgi:two-component system phosphate regulon response regulator OmpR
VVEDDVAQRQLLVQYLLRQGMRATGVADGQALRREIQREVPALVLLDVHLPVEDGFSLIRYLREACPAAGVIMVSVSSDTIDRVAGLESGADDFVSKPFEPRELFARVKSVLRRASASAGGDPAGPKVAMGRRVLDLERRLLLDPDGIEERLAPGEFNLLKLFVENPNRPLARDWLLEVTSHREAEAYDRAIDLRITRLRRKIERDPGHPEAIRTVRGIGYMFVPKGA